MTQVRELTDPDDLLSRFLFQSGHFKSGRATPDAFMPPPDLQLSTFFTRDIINEAILAIGKEVLSTHTRDKLYGRAEFRVQAVWSHN
jgi:hypothetical protein